MDRLRLASLILGHALVDCYMALIIPLMPNIRERLGISQEQIGYLVVWISISGSLAQPVFGWLSDRTRSAYLIGTGVALTAVGMSTFGMAHRFWPMVLLLSVAGIGCSAFHPAGAALAARAGGRRRDLALGIFSPGGILGYSAGPLFAVWLNHRLGLEHMWPVIVLGLALGPTIGALASGLERRGAAGSATIGHPVRPDGERMARPVRYRALALVLLVVLLRSAVIVVFTNFLAQLLKERGISEAGRGYWTSAFVFAGGAAGIAGGYLGGRVGRRVLTVVSLGLTAPGLLLFLHARGPGSWVSLVLAGATAQAALPANISQAQLLLPRRQSLASALTMGFCWGMASLLAPLVGRIADRTTLTHALTLACAIPLAGAAIGAFLPDVRSAEAPTPTDPLPVPPAIAEIGEG